MGWGGEGVLFVKNQGQGAHKLKDPSSLLGYGYVYVYKVLYLIEKLKDLLIFSRSASV